MPRCGWLPHPPSQVGAAASGGFLPRPRQPPCAPRPLPGCPRGSTTKSAPQVGSHHTSGCSRTPAGKCAIESLICGYLVGTLQQVTKGLRISLLCSWQRLTAHHVAAVFDGDNVFLHGADRIAHGLEQETGSKWRGSYFMPAQADR